ncbi:MAG TPA: hypothetical protein VGH73_08580 [Thermoanaerobaculia bacterium]
MSLLGDDNARKALLACSAALNLNDDVARRAIALVAQSNGSTDTLLDRIKGLSCVWKQWDGTWYVAEDVRASLVDRLGAEVPSDVRNGLHELLADAADQRLLELVPDGQLFDYRVRACHLEAGYQQIQVTRHEEAGAERLLTAWQQGRLEARDATAAAVDHLASDLERQGHRLPDQVLFLRGMAARSRRDWGRAELYFRMVWEHGQPGEIQAIAAHLFANLTRDRKAAEQALRDSLAWNSEPFHRAQVWHSLGNLLARERNRSKEAEDAYQKSLELRHDPQHQGQVYASWANALAREGKMNLDELDRAAELAHKARQIDPKNLHTRAIATKVLAEVFREKGDLRNELEALEELLELERKRYRHQDAQRTEHRIREIKRA